MKKWMQRLVRLAKEEKGLTLVELLAVIVVLGIVAAIAVPQITGIVGNTKKEAHKANAKQFIEAAKQVVSISGFKANHASADFVLNHVVDGKVVADQTVAAADADDKIMDISLATLQTLGYFGDVKDPENNASPGNYVAANQIVYVYKDGTTFKYYVSIDSANNASDFRVVPENEIDELSLN
jgi:prepilin-type N-terminal cleavage/methylation domain-containing protein